MTKEAFLKRIAREKPVVFPYDIETEHITDSSFVIGCAFVDGFWKVFETTERTGHYIIEELTDENKAFDDLYMLIKSLEKDLAETSK